jgi:hypothetical protein
MGPSDVSPPVVMYFNILAQERVMPRCKNRGCEKEYSLFLEFVGKSYTYTEKSIRRKLCQECIETIVRWTNSKPPEERRFYETIGINYFCRDCNRINLSFDDSKSSYQDDNKFCTCRNKYIDGLPRPKHNDEEEWDNPWDDGC